MPCIKTPSEIAEIRARAEKATPGPIEVRAWIDPQAWVLEAPGNNALAEFGVELKYDADFYAAARTDVPELCDSHEAQAQRIAELEAWVIGASQEKNDLLTTAISRLRSELSTAREALAQERALAAKLPHEPTCASKKVDRVPFGEKAREQYYSDHQCSCIWGRIQEGK